MDTSIIKLKRTFEMFDRDGSGAISIKELKQVLQALGQSITEIQLQEIIAEIDTNSDGEISFEEFSSLSIISRDTQSQEQDLMQVFQKFDKNGDGYIDVQEISSEAMSILNKNLSESEIIEMFRIADNDGNGQLDYDEFVKVIMAKSAEVVSSDTLEISPKLIGFQFVRDIPEQAWKIVEQLQQQANSHTAFNHPYLQRLAEGHLPDVMGALQDFAVQYAQYSNNFKTYLDLTISQLTNPEHQELILENSQEENGDLDEWSPKQLTDLGIDLEWVDKIPHTLLFKRFQKALGVTKADFDQVCPEALQFRNRIQEICSQNVASAIGAIGLAGELGVSQIYTYILQAIKRYTPLAPREYVFFTLHTQMDDEHTQALKAIAADLANTEESRKQLSQAMTMALEARNSFWDALLERALKMPESKNKFVSPDQLYETNSQKWVRKEPSCLSDFTARPAIFELCEPVKDAVILDLGCGEGYCARELMRRGASKVIGVDISVSSIAAAQAEEQREPNGITYLTGNSTNVRQLLKNHRVVEESEGFDLIVAVFLFNYLTFHEMVQCMTQVEQLLKPGGRFIFSIPHPSFAFWSKPEATFHFDVAAFNGSENKSLGYFSARDRLLPGTISRRDGTKLPVQVRHKTMQDYFDALRESGFVTLPQVQELKVTDSHLQLDPSFFGSLEDVPLHMAFSIEKPEFPTPKRLTQSNKAIIPDILWSGIFSEEDYCFQFPSKALEEFYQARIQLQANNITWENYHIGDAGELPHLQAFAHKMRDCCYDTTGFVLIQGLPLEEFGNSYEEREATAKLLYYMMSVEIGLVSERRSRLFDVRDRGLNVADDNVLFSVTKEASGWHTDSTDKNFNPDIVGLLCLQDGKEGGVLQNVNALNVYYRLKQILPQSIFEELEQPIIRDLIEKGLGKDSGDTWEQLRRSSSLGVQNYRVMNNRFPIFSRDPYTNEFTCRYMRYWIESGHKKANVPLSPLLKIAINTLDQVIDNDPTIYRVERKLCPGEIIYTNNHICLHNRTAYEEKVDQPRRHMVRVWIDFNPQWSLERQ
ncbi:MAG: EF-hand domain-containing protein [Brasilonema angustatum HA4187-MV1]|jgi:Ca2+-binding EF-hand superfamily protein/pyrroloquinoline quinone (PQQ) biosynthesis protein C|nr:EF-hand domain-containing protein [Brasilonema angustatum HA4187-MV1]